MVAKDAQIARKDREIISRDIQLEVRNIASHLPSRMKLDNIFRREGDVLMRYRLKFRPKNDQLAGKDREIATKEAHLEVSH